MNDYDQPQPWQNVGSQSVSSGLATDSIVRYRLDMNDLLRDIELYLSGKRYAVQSDEFGVREVLVDSGMPLMNQRGIQSILGSLKLLLGPHTVQGNLDKDQYGALIEEINIYLARDIMVNRINWEVALDDFPFIVDTLVWTILLFLSRTIEDKERASYGNTIRSVQTNTIGKKQSSGIGGWFGIGG